MSFVGSIVDATAVIDTSFVLNSYTPSPCLILRPIKMCVNLVCVRIGITSITTVKHWFAEALVAFVLSYFSVSIFMTSFVRC